MKEKRLNAIPKPAQWLFYCAEDFVQAHQQGFSTLINNIIEPKDSLKIQHQVKRNWPKNRHYLSNGFQGFS